MSLRVSCADSTFPRLSHEAALTVIKDLGISAVDVCSFTGYPHTPPDTILADPKGAAHAVRDRSLEYFEQCLAFARRLRAPGVTILPGMVFHGVSEEASIELAATEH